MSETDIFQRGGEAAQTAADSQGGGRNFRRTVYRPKIGPNSQIVIRYLLDWPEIYHISQHMGVKTKPKPGDWPEGRNYPATMGAICRYDKQFKEHGTYSDCYICDNKLQTSFGGGGFATPKVRIYSLAVLREEIFGTPEMVAQGMIKEGKVGKVVGFADKKRTVSIPRLDENGSEIKGNDGKLLLDEVEEPEIVVINEAMNTWFTNAKALYNVYGTICDRDIVVRQEGVQKDVNYPHIPMDVTPNLAPGTELWRERYLAPLEAMGTSFSIPHIMMGQSSDEYYGRFFDPSKAVSSAGGVQTQKSAPEAQQQAAPSNDASADKLAAMRERLLGGNAPASQGSASTGFDPVGS